MPGDLPEAITVDIAGLRIGQSVRIAHLDVEGITFREPADAVVVSVKMARGAVASSEEEEEEAAAE